MTMNSTLRRNGQGRRRAGVPAIHCYVRVSSDKQENSERVQRALLDSYCGKLEGVRVEPWVDLDVSGWTTRLEDRPAGKRMLNALRPGDHIAVLSVDRLGRDIVENFVALSNLRNTGAHIHILDRGGEIDAYSVLEGMQYFLESMGAKLYADVMSTKIKQAKAQLKCEGRPSTNRPFYGWYPVFTRKNGKTKDSTFEPCERERRLILEIYRRVENNESHRSIWRDFQARGERTAANKSWSIARIGRCHRFFDHFVREGGILKMDWPTALWMAEHPMPAPEPKPKPKNQFARKVKIRADHEVW